MSLSASPSSWPAFLIGLILLAYWLRVLYMVARTRRTQGRAANFIPPELLGRVLRWVWVPVVVLWIFVPLTTPFLRGLPVFLEPFSQISQNRLIGWCAFAVAAGAFAATWICWHNMGSSWRMGIDPNERTQLVVSGAYAYVRHPIYALSSLLMFATIAAVCSPLIIIVGVLHLLLLQWEARREERYLAILHGAPYLNYAEHVGRFLPQRRAGRT